MGIIISYIWNDSGKTDDPDPSTGLTSRDRYILKTSWKRITDGQAALNTGISVFINLFEYEPKYLQLFPFRDVPLTNLKKNNRFRAHCITLIYGFSSIVENVDDPPVLEQLLAKQAISHVPRGVPNEAYWELKQVLLKLFRMTMNELEMVTWEKFLQLGFEIMVKYADEERNRNIKDRL